MFGILSQGHQALSSKGWWQQVSLVTGLSSCIIQFFISLLKIYFRGYILPDLSLKPEPLAWEM